MGKVFNQIIEGYKELIKEKSGGEQLPFVTPRFRQCSSCSLFTGVICNPEKEVPHIETGVMTKGCGCIIQAKIRSKNSQCPLGKWKEQASLTSV